MLGSVISFFAGWQVKLALVLALVFGAYTWHKAEVRIAVKETVAQIEMQSNKERFRLKERSLDSQIALQQKADDIQKEKDAKIKTLTSRVAALTRSLSERPNRPEASGISINPGTQESQPGATGVQLYRQDGEFLAREAARAEEIKEELLGCYKSYDAARTALEKFKKDNAE